MEEEIRILRGDKIRMKKKPILIFDKRVEWFRELIDHVSKGHVFLDNIKVTKKISEEWDHVSFDYRIEDLKNAMDERG